MATNAQFIQFGPYYSAGSLCTLKCYHYTAGTTTAKDMWTTRDKLVSGAAVAQPLLSDSDGIASAYGDGLYKFRIDGSTDGVNYSTMYTYDNVAVLDQTTTSSGEGAAINSASTLTLGTDGNIFHVSGSTGPITAISGLQTTVTLVFDSTPTLTHSGSLILQYAADYTVAANHTMTLFNEGSNVWREISRTPEFGPLTVTSGSPTGTVRTTYWADESMALGQSWEVKNLTIIATVGSNALTLALKTKNGTDPSSTDPIILKFRNATLGTGDYATVSLTAAASLVISSGSTLGTASGVASRIYLGLCNDGGTLRLFAYNPLASATLSLAGLGEGAVYSSTAEGGAGAADSTQVLYSGTAFSSKAIRLLGYVESTQATAGTWATTPSKIHILKLGDKRTGDSVQTQGNATGAVATGTTVIPNDDTIPQITEGTEFLTQAITPTSSINVLMITHIGYYASSSSDGGMQACLFQDATANALAVTHGGRNAAASARCQITMEHAMQAGTTSSTTFRLRSGTSGAGTTTFNGTAGTRDYGGVISSFLRVEEIFV